MRRYQLTRQDLDRIDNIVQVTKSIDTLYNKLYTLEQSNQKSTPEYQKYLEFLNISLETESNAYQKMDLDEDKAIAIMEVLFRENGSSEMLIDMEAIVIQDDLNRIMRRILNNLERFAKSQVKNIADNMPEEMQSVFSMMGIENFGEMIANSIDVNIKMEDALNRDALRTFLSFIEDAMKDKSNRQHKNSLLRVKYDLAFINDDIEMDMVEKQFQVEHSVILGSRFTSEVLRMGPIYGLLKNKYGLEISQLQITKLLQISDKEYREPKKSVTSVLRQAYLRSAFLLLDDEILSDISNQFTEYARRRRFTSFLHHDKMSNATILEAIKLIQQDREKHKVISLNPNPTNY